MPPLTDLISAAAQLLYLRACCLVCARLAVCNWLGGNATAYNIAWSGTSQFQAAPMQTWTTSAGTVAGQVRHYANMQFARVYNASHMVPSKQPAVALDMINTFMAGQPLVP